MARSDTRLNLQDKKPILLSVRLFVLLVFHVFPLPIGKTRFNSTLPVTRYLSTRLRFNTA